MKTNFPNQKWLLGLMTAAAFCSTNMWGQDTLVKPSRGGGLDTSSPMIHVDVFFDHAANQMLATLDTSQGVPKLLPLPPGYAFDSRSNYYVLSGKPYNFQYAWNPGGIFTNPPGAALWVECISASPGLETYDGPGNKMINPQRTYGPIFGTSGSSAKWPWYKAMAHNSYAILNPTTNLLTAEYRLYFADEVTGARDNYLEFDDATVQLTWTVDPVTLVRPARGGGVDTNAPMIHVDIFYDYAANQMHADLDTSYGVPKLLPLPLGYAFDVRSNYYVLTGKAYSLQYAWNPGGIFTNPPGAAVWIECLGNSPGLENYDGPGNKNENPARPYTPILGTAGSPPIWQWYGRMAHNAFAVANPATNVLTATYRVYFGDATTGSREGYMAYDDDTVTLTWTVDPATPQLQFRCGATESSAGSALCLLDAWSFSTDSQYVVTLLHADTGPCAGQYEGTIPMLALPATAANGGPAQNHAALGSCLEFEVVSLAGPPGATLGFWETGEMTPRFTLGCGQGGDAKRFCLSAASGAPGSDPYGDIAGRRFGASEPGLYCLSFRLVDSSLNGTSGGPLHTPSEVYRVYLQAGLVANSFTKGSAAATLTFGGQLGANFYLERSSVLGSGAQWRSVAGPLFGVPRLQSLADPNPAGGANFYRVRTSVP